MGPDPHLTDLLPLLPAGDDRAARAVFDRYSERLVRLGRVGPEDVGQSVFRTFFRRGLDGEFQLDGSAQLWQLLVKITVLKARAKTRYHTADRRGAGAEQAPADGFDPGWAQSPRPYGRGLSPAGRPVRR